MAFQGEFTELKQVVLFSERQILDQLILSINNAIKSIHVELQIPPLSDDQQYKLDNNNQVLHCKLSEYAKLLLLHGNDLPTKNYKFVLDTFYLLVHNIDEYVTLLSADYKTYGKLHYKLLMNKSLFILLSFKFKCTRHINGVSLFYSNDLISIQSTFKELIHSYYNNKNKIPKDSVQDMAKYFENEYHLTLHKYNMLYLNELDLNNKMDFVKGYNRVLLSYYNHIQRNNNNINTDTIINEICGLTICLLFENNNKCDEFLVSSLISNIEEYYGYFISDKPFLCFYCNKLKTSQRGLRQHLRASHEGNKQNNRPFSCMDYICYIMLTQLFILIFKTNYKPNVNPVWLPNNILTKYINQLNILSENFNFYNTETKLKNMNKSERLEFIMNNVNNILSIQNNLRNEAKEDHNMEINDTYYESSTSITSSTPSSTKSEERIEFDLLPFETKRAMMTAHYIATKLHSYFKRYHYCNASNENYMFILDNIYIVGGAIRNYLIGRNIVDLDIIVDTLKLQYLQNKHLLIHHECKQMEYQIYSENIKNNCNSWDQTNRNKIPCIPLDDDYGLNKESLQYKKWKCGKKKNCKCLWHLQYYKQFSSKCQRNNLYENNQYLLHNADWIFNAKTLSRILINEMKKDFNGNLCISVFVDKNQVMRFNLKSHLIINGIDISGQIIDITDTSNHKDNNIGKFKKQSLNEYQQKYPYQLNYNNNFFFYSYTQKAWIQKLKYGTIRHSKYHKCSLKNDIINRDFTINALILPLSTILIKKQCFKWNNNDIIDLVNGMYDIKHKIFRVAPMSSVKHILKSSPIRLLRVIKYCLIVNDEKNEFIIDHKLKQGVTKYGYLLKSMSCTAIQQVFMPIVQTYYNDVRKTKEFLSMLKEYHLEEILIEIIMSDGQFCKHFLNVVSKFNAEIQCVYEKHKYPSIFSVNEAGLTKALKQKKYQILEQKRCNYNLIQAVRIIDYLLAQFGA